MHLTAPGAPTSRDGKVLGGDARAHIGGGGRSNARVVVAAGDADPCARFPASIGVSVDLAFLDALRSEHRVAPEPEEGVGRPGVVQGPRASQPLERPEGAGQRAEAGFAPGGSSPL